MRKEPLQIKRYVVIEYSTGYVYSIAVEGAQLNEDELMCLFEHYGINTSNISYTELTDTKYKHIKYEDAKRIINEVEC